MALAVLHLLRRAVAAPSLLPAPRFLATSAKDAIMEAAGVVKVKEKKAASPPKEKKVAATPKEKKVAAPKKEKAEKAAVGDRDETKSKTEESFVALLRRVANSVEAGKGFEMQVKNERVWVPENAKCSVEHEKKGSKNEIELQLKWTVREGKEAKEKKEESPPAPKIVDA